MTPLLCVCYTLDKLLKCTPALQHVCCRPPCEGVGRNNYKIYPPDYGVELEELIGKRRSYVEADIERRINEALMQDDRILRTRDYSFAFDRESLEVQCTADTIFGSVPLTRRFSIGDSTNIR